jgi:hypothetical protein
LVLSVDIQGTFVYATLSSSSSLTEPITVGNLSTGLIPSADSVHNTETLELPPDTDAFIILIAK